MRTRILLTICVLFLSRSTWGEVNLDKLRDCQGLKTIQSRLNGSISQNCRAPGNRLEAAVMAQFASNIQTCLLASSLTAKLNGFSCIEIAATSQRELTCFNTLDKSVLDNYRTTYDSGYGRQIRDYLNEAGQCAIANGDATESPDLLPSFLRSVATFRFGFALQIGTEQKSQVFLGYADLDSNLRLSGLGSIEAFDFLKVSETPAQIPPSCRGSTDEIVASVNDFPQEARSVEPALQRQYQKPVVYKLRSIDFTYCGTKSIPQDKKMENLNGWQEDVGYRLDTTDFREPTPEDFSNTPFRDEDDLARAIANNLPGGYRNSQNLGPHLVFRMDDSSPLCIAIAEAMVSEPVEDVKSDYGGIGIVFVGIGDCRRAERPGGTLSNQLLDTVTGDVRSDAGVAVP